VLGQVAQALLGEAAFGEVLNLRDEVQRLALQIARERHRQQRADHVPARVQVALLQLIVADLTDEQPLHVLGVERQVVGVGDLLQALGLQLFGGVAADLQKRLVDAHPAPIGRDQRDADGRALEQQLKALLRMPARLLGVAALGDIGERSDAAADCAVLVGERRDVQLVTVRLACGPQLARI
jgi:hypothetical protein